MNQMDTQSNLYQEDGENSMLGSEFKRNKMTTKEVTHENSDIDLRLQAQEHMYRHTLTREKTKVSLHALEEVGRSITAISQRRRQYFLDYKTCDSIRQIRQWFAWETKRNIDTNHAPEAKPENAATRGLKTFLNKVDFYGTLLARFGEYIIYFLLENYDIEHDEVNKTKDKMLELQDLCARLLSDNNEVVLDSPNHTEVENKFPVISILRQVHDTLCQMTDLSTVWRMHARFAGKFSSVEERRSQLPSVLQLDEKKETIKNLESRIRISKYDITEVERELREREISLASTEFREVYNTCTDKIEELSDGADEKKLEIKSLDTTIKYLHEKTDTYKKMVQHKRKEKLEFNMRKREEKLRELNTILAEVARLEEHKKRLDLKEEMWLRGGFEQELGVIQDLKNKLIKFRKAALDLEKQKEDEKDSYYNARKLVMQLDHEFERLNREYEYVKRLSTTLLPSQWRINIFDQLSTNAVKPNRVSADKALTEDAYQMSQPKGVAMIINNDDEKYSPVSPRSITLAQDFSPLSSTRPVDQLEATSERANTVVKCLTSLYAQLGFYIMSRFQLSNDAMHRNMAAMSDQYHTFACNLNSLFVLVSSQSDEYGRLLGTEDTKARISTTSYLKYFSHSGCPALVEKPKVFIFMLRVTEHDPSPPIIDQHTQKNKRKTNNRFSSFNSEDSSQDSFQPEPIDVSEYGDDILLVRIMHQHGGGAKAAPTFGGTATPNRDKLPWHVQVLISTIMEQASYKDFLSVLEYVKEEVAMAPKTRMSPTQAKPEVEETEVDIFIDHSLKKKVYLMPGL
ncbi:uncharacterized protein LOC120346786 [Styela clava]